ncbi:MAG: hypothetical protein IE927_00925 [Rhodobacterales bacterium]|nr:hypothetical protein [Rhodobacterales bacterium]
MAESGDSLVLEQLRLIRADLGELRSELAAFKDETHSDFVAQKTMLFGLASVIGQIGERVGHLERKIGA